MPGETFYEILGVTPDADENKIKRAYKTLASKNHPDKEGGDEEKFKKITEAYETLSDSEKKLEYDRSLRAGAERMDPLQLSQLLIDNREKLPIELSKEDIRTIQSINNQWSITRQLKEQSNNATLSTINEKYSAQLKNALTQKLMTPLNNLFVFGTLFQDALYVINSLEPNASNLVVLIRENNKLLSPLAEKIREAKAFLVQYLPNQGFETIPEVINWATFDEAHGQILRAVMDLQQKYLNIPPYGNTRDREFQDAKKVYRGQTIQAEQVEFANLYLYEKMISLIEAANAFEQRFIETETADIKRIYASVIPDESFPVILRIDELNSTIAHAEVRIKIALKNNIQQALEKITAIKDKSSFHSFLSPKLESYETYLKQLLENERLTIDDLIGLEDNVSKTTPLIEKIFLYKQFFNEQSNQITVDGTTIDFTNSLHFSDIGFLADTLERGYNRQNTTQTTKGNHRFAANKKRTEEASKFNLPASSHFKRATTIYPVENPEPFLKKQTLSSDEKELKISREILRSLLEDPEHYPTQRNKNCLNFFKRLSGFDGSTTIKQLRLLLATIPENGTISLEQTHASIHRDRNAIIFIEGVKKTGTDYVITELEKAFQKVAKFSLNHDTQLLFDDQGSERDNDLESISF